MKKEERKKRMPNKIIDEFTDLPISRQRKWQLRHPEEEKALNKRYNSSLHGRIVNREYKREKLGCKKRHLNCKSYREERKEVKNRCLS